jgi:hypothetical protein
VLEVALDGAALAGHPEDHPGEDAGRGDGDERERHEPGVAVQRAGREVDREADAGGNPDAGGDAEPHRTGEVGATDAAQVGVEDADDERRLEPLAQHDQERLAHG